MNSQSSVPVLFWPCLVVAVGLMLPAAASAQNAAADVLFDEAQALIEQGKDAEAAEKLRQSNELDPAPGTALNLAEVYLRLGRYASAWAAYRSAAALAAGRGQQERQRFAEAQVAKLEPKLSKITVRVPEEAQIEGLSISRDGKAIPRALWGRAIPVDPGKVHFRAEAPGRDAWELEVTVSDAATRSIIIPVLPDEDEPAPKASAASTPPSRPATVTGRPVEGEDGQPLLPYAAYAGIGIGALTAGLGVFFYLDGRATMDDANCRDAVCVRGVGNANQYEDGRSTATMGGVLMAGGGVLLGAGLLTLLLVDGPESSAAAWNIRATANARGGALFGSGVF